MKDIIFGLIHFIRTLIIVTLFGIGVHKWLTGSPDEQVRAFFCVLLSIIWFEIVVIQSKIFERGKK